MTNEERQQRELAEQGLEARDRRSFRSGLLDVLSAVVGFDKGSVQSFPRLHDIALRGYEQRAAFDELHNYMNELEPKEIAIAATGRPFVDLDVLPARRRERLALYHQFLHPERITVFMSAMWHDHHGVSGIAIARTGRGARFSANEVQAVERLLPTIRLADSFVALRQREPETPSLDAWADDAGLGAKERGVAELVVRGLPNREIAALLGVSPNTVRNQLASVFRKAGVSTRAELVFMATTFRRAEGARFAPQRWLQYLR